MSWQRPMLKRILQGRHPTAKTVIGPFRRVCAGCLLDDGGEHVCGAGSSSASSGTVAPEALFSPVGPAGGGHQQPLGRDLSGDPAPQGAQDAAPCRHAMDDPNASPDEKEENFAPRELDFPWDEPEEFPLPPW